MKTIAISGNTYPVRNQLKALGGRWNPSTKSWSVPENKADEARALVRSTPTRSMNLQYCSTFYPNRFTAEDAQEASENNEPIMVDYKWASTVLGLHGFHGSEGRAEFDSEVKPNKSGRYDAWAILTWLGY